MTPASPSLASRMARMSYSRRHSAARRMNRSPMRSRSRVPMVGPMASGSERTLGKYVSVTIEAAARLVDVDVATIRHWSDVGSIEIEQRGDMDVVRLDQVRQLTTTSRKEARTRHGSLRALLRDAEKVESLNVSGLQQHVREKAGDAS